MTEHAQLSLLFVDDEPNVLVGIRRSLAGMRTRWAMSFVSGGEQALETMATEPVDVVISDLRMPGLDGVDLLREVRQRHPHAIRIILSGSTDKESLYRSLDCAHQYLTKPCDSADLQAVIERVQTARRHLDREAADRVVACAESMPRLPEVHQRLLGLVSTPNVETKEIAELLQDDLVLSAQVLRLVNSAMFGLSRQVDDITTALVLLGLDAIKGIVLSHGLCGQEDTPAEWFVAEAVRDHSYAVGTLARWLGEVDEVPRSEATDLFISSVLHNIGLLVLAAAAPDPPGPNDLVLSDRDWEHSVLGTDRYAIGAYVLAMWGFSTKISEAVALLSGPLPEEEGLASRLWIAHHLASVNGLSVADLSTLDRPSARRLLADITELRQAVGRR
jgi:HD-like signal output (HDOD) protein/CheY-like chemotaxis protein